jgi:copper transport protein
VRRLLPALLLLVAVLGGALALDVSTAGPALAHATVTATTPADGARLDAAPAEVTVEFDEGVSLGAGNVRVLDTDGSRVDTGTPTVRDAVLTVALGSDLPDGGYVVTYRVVSADSHPITGAWSFVVGDGALPAASAVDEGGSADPVVAAALPATRWLGYLGLALGLGVPVLVATCWAGGWGVPLLRRLSVAGLVAVAVTALLSLALQGPYAAGAGLGSLADPGLLSATLGSAYGRTLLGRALLALALAGLLALAWRRGRPPGTPLLAGAGVLAVGLVVGVAAVGHPVAGPLPALAVAVTAVHVAAMACWLGGLAALAAAALLPGFPVRELRPVLVRWSLLAAGLVTALVLSGVLQSVREVGSPVALVSTTYGWVLLAKVALVLAVLAVAAVSRDWVQQRLGGRPRRPSSGRRVVAQAFAAAPAGADAVPADDAGASTDEPGPAEVRSLRRSVLLEVAGAVVVLALSAVLVGTPPARAAIATPVEVTLPLQRAGGGAAGGDVLVSVAPASPGPTTLHVYLYDADGELTQPREVHVTLAERQQQIGPLEVDLAGAGPGHYVGDGTVLPTAGTWTLTVSVRLDEFTAATASTVFAVR